MRLAALAPDWSGDGSTWQLDHCQCERTGAWATAGSAFADYTQESFASSSRGRAAIFKSSSRLQRRSKAWWDLMNCHSWQITVVLNLGLQRQRVCISQTGSLAYFESGLGRKTNCKQTISTWEMLCAERKLSCWIIALVRTLSELALRTFFLFLCESGAGWNNSRVDIYQAC